MSIQRRRKIKRARPPKHVNPPSALLTFIFAMSCATQKEKPNRRIIEYRADDLLTKKRRLVSGVKDVRSNYSRLSEISFKKKFVCQSRKTPRRRAARRCERYQWLRRGKTIEGNSLAQDIWIAAGFFLSFLSFFGTCSLWNELLEIESGWRRYARRDMKKTVKCIRRCKRWYNGARLIIVASLYGFETNLSEVGRRREERKKLSNSEKQLPHVWCFAGAIKAHNRQFRVV